MSIKLVCNCGRAYWVPEDKAGRRFACKACGAVIVVPAAVTASAPVIPRQLPPDILQREVSAGIALASNPGCAKLNYLQFFMCRPLLAAEPLAVLIAGLIVLALTGNPLPLLVLLPIVVVRAHWRTRRIRRTLMVGCINPAIVIGKSPWRVAVYTNLTRYQNGLRPAVKVVQLPLTFMAGGPAQIGLRLAAPSTYWSGNDPSAWATFVPIVMATAVRDPAVLESALRSIEESDWEELEFWLAKNPNPELGLYRLWPGAKDSLLKPTRARKAGIAVLIVVIAVAITVFLIVFGKVH